ncbi:MAG: FecR domain-containing protein [Gammaproteobacteria bacterium]|nr:FecR domain-containing protein [Gammaproteobacteria bacterium]
MAALSLGVCLMLGGPVRAQEDDPPTRAARLSVAEGAVSFEPAGTQDWVAATINRPLTNGDRLWDDRDSRSEIQLDGSTIRLGSESAASILNLNDTVTQVQLTAGTLIAHVRRLGDDETYEIDTPNLAFSILRPGTYRLSVNEAGDTTSIYVSEGQGEVTGGGSAVSVRPGEFDVFSGTDQLTEDQPPPPAQDEFDSWSRGRDARWARLPSARYVSPDVVGYEDLDEHGDWQTVPEYGSVWFPRAVAPGWAPYHTGHWSYVPPWGYTWIDDEPWGYAPFHYGRWVHYRDAWGWVPAPPPPPDAPYVHPVYAPALVAWVGVGAAVAWFALGPREVYVPSYPVSRNYVNNVNISNTTVNRTVINNVYNTTVVNNTVVNNTVINNVTYVNRTVPGAVAATTQQAFASAQPVNRNQIRVEQRALQTAAVRPVAPPVVPSKQAMLGNTRPAAAPPPKLASRTVVARVAPPPPPPSVDTRIAAIRNNGGKPLSVVQVRQIQSQQPQKAPVRIAPPASPRAATLAAPRPATPAETAHAPAPAQAPARAPAPAPAPVPAPAQRAEPAPPPRADRPPAASGTVPPSSSVVHPNDLPHAEQPRAPAAASSVLERQHLQAQQQLYLQQQQAREQLQRQQQEEHQRQQEQQQQAQREAQQQAERQRQQQQQQQAQQQQAERQRQQEQQQQAERQRLQQQADQRQKQLEEQHRQQTQALQQQHEQQRQQLQQRQEEERRQQEAQSRPPAKRADRPPEAH